MKISYKIFKSLAAMAVGTLGLCMSEFSMMACLGPITQSLDVSIPDGGHFVSAYALGVCAGAPMLVFFARGRPLRAVLIFLMGAFVIGNCLTALAYSEFTMLGARFIAGLPHGAYFGVASIVAAMLGGPAYSVMAVSIVVFGATLANLIGVPVATFASWLLSWRVAYFMVAIIGVLTIITIFMWVPPLRAMKDTGLRNQFKFLRSPAPWIVSLAVIMGNGGMFCWYSYISPFMHKDAGIGAGWMTAIMFLAGAGMVFGDLISGKLSTKFSDYKIACAFQFLMFVSLLSIFLWGQSPFFALAFMTLSTISLFGLSAPQQMLLLETSPGGQLLGAALAQVGFNLGNAVGAFSGGLAIRAGLDYGYTALIGACFAVVGFCMLILYSRKYSDKFKNNAIN